MSQPAPSDRTALGRQARHVRGVRRHSGDWPVRLGVVPAGVAGVLGPRFTPCMGVAAFSGSLLLLLFAVGRIKQIGSVCVARHADRAHRAAGAVPVDWKHTGTPLGGTVLRPSRGRVPTQALRARARSPNQPRAPSPSPTTKDLWKPLPARADSGLTVAWTGNGAVKRFPIPHQN